MAQTVKAIGQDVTDDIRPYALQDLQRTPGKSHSPVIWANDDQRKAYFATDGFGRGIPTRRTGKAQAGWQVKNVAASDGYSMIIANSVAYAKYLYGSLAQDGSGLRFQQKQHRATGWIQAQPIVAYWLDRATEDFKERYEEAIGEFGKATLGRTAYTKGTPRKKASAT